MLWFGITWRLLLRTYNIGNLLQQLRSNNKPLPEVATTLILISSDALHFLLSSIHVYIPSSVVLIDRNVNNERRKLPSAFSTTGLIAVSSRNIPFCIHRTSESRPPEHLRWNSDPMTSSWLRSDGVTNNWPLHNQYTKYNFWFLHGPKTMSGTKSCNDNYWIIIKWNVLNSRII